MKNVLIPIMTIEYKSKIFLPKLSTMSVEIYVDTTAITPMMIVDTFDPILLPVAYNTF